MSPVNGTATRSAILELRDERRAMREGHRFLDEKCLLLAGEILRQLARHRELEDRLRRASDTALSSLVAAVARHGLDALQVHLAAPADASSVALQRRALIGVPLFEAKLDLVQPSLDPALDASPEARDCAIRFADLTAVATEIAAVTGNLERLHAEYRRAVRRARALQDVLLPEIDRTLADFVARVDELEQEEAVWMRASRRAP
jgi:V/A-type H+-transporting ATPase subunit D